MDETRTAGRSEQVWTTARSYENGAIEWYRLASEVDRAAWRPSYDRFADLLHPGATVLDLGCGAGLDVAGLAEAGLQLVGLDISSRLLALTQTKGLMEGRVIKGDLRSLPIRAGSFDGVWADGSLHHVPKADVVRALREAGRVLRVGGVLCASVEIGEGEDFVTNDELPGPRWYAHYRPEELRELFVGSGFEVVDAFVGEPGLRTAGFVSMTGRKR